MEKERTKVSLLILKRYFLYKKFTEQNDFFVFVMTMPCIPILRKDTTQKVIRFLKSRNSAAFTSEILIPIVVVRSWTHEYIRVVMVTTYLWKSLNNFYISGERASSRSLFSQKYQRETVNWCWRSNVSLGNITYCWSNYPWCEEVLQSRLYILRWSNKGLANTKVWLNHQRKRYMECYQSWRTLSMHFIVISHWPICNELHSHLQ